MGKRGEKQDGGGRAWMWSASGGRTTGGPSFWQRFWVSLGSDGLSARRSGFSRCWLTTLTWGSDAVEVKRGVTVAVWKTHYTLVQTRHKRPQESKNCSQQSHTSANTCSTTLVVQSCGAAPTSSTSSQ